MIHVIIGTKAQLIKMAPVMKKLQEKNIDFNYIYTGQHRETMEDIHRNFCVKSFDQILYDSGDIVSMSAMMRWFIQIIGIGLFRSRVIFKNDKKGIVLVHGDTISTLLGAIMAKLAGLKVAHIESGLRSFNIFHPFPEEITRLVTFALSDYCFCPGKWAVNNLKKYNCKKINMKMNTLYDSINQAMPLISYIDDVKIPSKKYVVVSIHRFENIHDKNRMKQLVKVLNNLTETFHVVFILHNPTKRAIEKFKLEDDFNKEIEFRNRYDYFRFVKLITHAEFIISDGGSNQEECFYLGKPILLYRKTSERREGIGENAFLSEYKKDKINRFIANYANHSRKMLEVAESPVDIVVKSVQKYS